MRALVRSIIIRLVSPYLWRNCCTDSKAQTWQNSHRVWNNNRFTINGRNSFNFEKFLILQPTPILYKLTGALNALQMALVSTLKQRSSYTVKWKLFSFAAFIFIHWDLMIPAFSSYCRFAQFYRLKTLPCNVSLWKTAREDIPKYFLSDYRLPPSTKAFHFQLLKFLLSNGPSGYRKSSFWFLMIFLFEIS